MIGHVISGILRILKASTSTPEPRETRSCVNLIAGVVLLVWIASAVKPAVSQSPANSPVTTPATAAATTPANSPATTRSAPVRPDDNYWDFSRNDDTDFNRWPDDWERFSGIGYPRYIKIAIVPHNETTEASILATDTSLVKIWPNLRETFPSLGPLPPSFSDLLVDRFLAIDLDGGQVQIQSPAHPTSQLYQYQFTCRMMTQGLRHDVARVSLVFLDSAGKELAALDAPAMRGTTDWTKLQIDRVRPPAHATQMLVRLSVLGSEDGLQDIHGRIGIDDIRIEPFPQLEVTSDKRLGVYDLGQPITIYAKVLGTQVKSSPVSFRLVDHSGKVIGQHRATATVKENQPNASKSKDANKRSPATTSSASTSLTSTTSATTSPATTPTAITSSATTSSAAATVDEEPPVMQWTLPSLEPGFYRVLCSFAEDTSTSLSTETTLAVVESLGNDMVSGPFGWSLIDGDRGLDPRELADWLAKLGVSVVKYPCWVAPDDAQQLEHNATVISRMQNNGITPIGVLDMPPPSELPHYEIPAVRDLVAANLFRDKNIWNPRLEPVMTQMTLKVRSWQLGGDRDYSFMGRPRLKEAIAEIANGLQGFGQPLDFAISWPWLEPMLSSADSGWHAYVRSTRDMPLTASELDSLLESEALRERGPQPATWLLVDPLDANRYPRNIRIQDLVLRMAAIRKHDVEVATVSNPYDEHTGLLTEDGRPDELLLPWRTAASLLGDVHYVGELKLRNGTNNQVFAGPQRAVLMMWSPSLNVEELYLGENVKQIDVWGRVTDVPTVTVDGRKLQRIETSPMPIFLVNVDATLLAFRMSVAIVENQIDSLLGQTQELHVVFTNPSRDAMVGEMRFLYPRTWQVDTPSRAWELLGAASAKEQFDIVLGNAAMVGQYEISLDFDFETTPPKRITVYRTMNVGVEGLSVKLTTKLTDSDELRVVMELTNSSAKPMSYDCMMFPPPGRQYQRRFVQIAPQETVTRDFYFSGGRELLGSTMLLRAIEQDGQRVVNFDTLITP